MSGVINTPFGPIAMRTPTQAEAIAFEDKLRAARRPRAATEQVLGGAYDNGLQQLFACVLSPDAKVLDVDDGWLADCPGIFDRMKEEFRRLGGYALDCVPCPEAIDDTARKNFGRKALGFEYSGQRIVARRMSYPEYNAFQANQTGENFWALLDAQGQACLVSHQGEGDLDRLLAGRPYLMMTLGIKLLDVAMGVAENAAGKSPSASSGKTAIFTSPPAISSQPDTAAAGASS